MPVLHVRRGLPAAFATLLVLGLIAFAIWGRVPAEAGPPQEFQLRTLASGLTQPTAFTMRSNGDLLVAEKGGRIVRFRNGTSQTFIDLSDRINSSADGGLLGLTSNATHVFVMYSRERNPAAPDRTDGADIVVARLAPMAGDPTKADPASLTVLVDGFDATPLNHLGGGLRFDGGGRLLASFGDGSDYRQVDPSALRSQNLDHPAGKLMRIDPATGRGVAGNPFFDPANPSSTRSRLIAFGLRNPFRFGLDPQTGSIYVADVGWDSWEEVNLIAPEVVDPIRERNFGWPCFEGGTTGPLVQPGYTTNPATAAACRAVAAPADGGTGPGTAGPLLALQHGGSQATGSITGGPVYRGSSYPERYRGKLFLADYASDRFWTYDAVEGLVPFGSSGGWGNPVDIQETPSGTIAYVAIGAGEVREIAHVSGNLPPIARASATPSQGGVPLATTFSAAGSLDPEGRSLTYTWNFGDGSGTATGTIVRHTYSRRGSFTATLTVRDPEGLIGRATLPIDVANTRPALRIETPQATFRVGDRIPYRIVATDAEDGVLKATSVTHQILVHHKDHLHYEPEFTGTDGTLAVNQHGDEVYYELEVTARDSLGGVTTTSHEYLPENRDLTIASRPSGATLILDGQARTAPHTRPSAVGAEHHLSAPATLSHEGTTYTLAGFDRNGTWVPGERLDFFSAETSEAITAVYADASGALFVESAVPPPAPPSSSKKAKSRRVGVLRRLVVRARPRLVRVIATGGKVRRGARLVVEARTKGRWRPLRSVPLRAGKRTAFTAKSRLRLRRVRVRVRPAARTPWRNVQVAIVKIPRRSRQ
ncbi:MAG: PQQ-dependent sugar dehydrogenase [Thermoleophilia bacterium]